MSPAPNTESTWRSRKPTHFPLLSLAPSPGPIDAHDSPMSTYHHRGSVLSVAPSIISNAPSTASGSSSDTPEFMQRHTKLERLRRKLGNELPATAVFPTTPRTAVPCTPKTTTTSTATTSKRSPRGRTHATARRPAQADDARSLAFSISSEESVHTVTLSARVRGHSPHPSRTRQKHVYPPGAIPPVPPFPAHLTSTSSRPSPSCSHDNDDVGLVRPRLKMAAGSKIGGSDFKAARRAKRGGRVTEPGEMVEMVGFLF